MRAADTTAPVIGELLSPRGSILLRPGTVFNLVMRWPVSDPESLTISSTVLTRWPDGLGAYMQAVPIADANGGPGAWFVDAGFVDQYIVQEGVYVATAVVCNAASLCSTKTAQIQVRFDLDPVAGAFVLAPSPVACPGSWLRFEREAFKAVSATLMTRRGAGLRAWQASTAELVAGRVWIGCEQVDPGAYLLKVRSDRGQGWQEQLLKVVVQP